MFFWEDKENHIEFVDLGESSIVYFTYQSDRY